MRRYIFLRQQMWCQRLPYRQYGNAAQGSRERPAEKDRQPNTFSPCQCIEVPNCHDHFPTPKWISSDANAHHCCLQLSMTAISDGVLLFKSRKTRPDHRVGCASYAPPATPRMKNPPCCEAAPRMLMPSDCSDRPRTCTSLSSLVIRLASPSFGADSENSVLLGSL